MLKNSLVAGLGQLLLNVLRDNVEAAATCERNLLQVGYVEDAASRSDEYYYISVVTPDVLGTIGRAETRPFLLLLLLLLLPLLLLIFLAESSVAV